MIISITEHTLHANFNVRHPFDLLIPLVVDFIVGQLTFGERENSKAISTLTTITPKTFYSTSQNKNFA